MNNAKNNDFCLYELQYRNNVFAENMRAYFDIRVSRETYKKTTDTLRELESIKPHGMKLFNFSDVIYEVFPAFDNETGNINYNNVPIFNDKEKSTDAYEYIGRYRNLDINKLPLIEVAHLLKIKVEKSNSLKAYGTYKPAEKKIILGTDYIPTFIHELAHAVDFHLSDHVYEKNYSELTAEISAITICKIFSIPVNLSYSLYYLYAYASPDIKAIQLIYRVCKIVECIIKINNIAKKAAG